MPGGKSSQDKGKRGEREIVKLLQPIVDKVYAEYPVMGDPPKLLRNTLQSAIGGFDILGLEWMAPEVKFCETPSPGRWWKQTIAQAGEGQEPVLFYRKTHVAWKVRMLMFARIGKKEFYSPADIEIDAFLYYFEHRLHGELEAKATLLAEAGL